MVAKPFSLASSRIVYLFLYTTNYQCIYQGPAWLQFSLWRWWPCIYIINTSGKDRTWTLPPPHFHNLLATRWSMTSHQIGELHVVYNMVCEQEQSYCNMLCILSPYNDSGVSIYINLSGKKTNYEHCLHHISTFCLHNMLVHNKSWVTIVVKCCLPYALWTNIATL